MPRERLEEMAMATKVKDVRTFTAGEDLELYRLVKLNSSGALVYADAGDMDAVIGATQTQGMITNADGTTDSGTQQVVDLLGAKTLLLCASAAIASGARVCVANDGKVATAASGERPFGIALQAASAGGSIIEVLPSAVDVEGMLFTSAGTIADNSWVKLDSNGKVTAAGANDEANVIGSVRLGGVADDVLRVTPLVGGIHYVVASEALTAEICKCAASGQVQDAGTTSTEAIIGFVLASASSGAVARILGMAYHVRNLS